VSNYPFLAGLLVAVMIASADHASAQTNDTDALKIKRLEATVEELTIQLADTIQERNRLRSALSQALEAKSQGRQVVVGCDLAAGHTYIAYHEQREGIAAGHWLSQNGNAKKCTKAQLQEISRTYDIKNWDKANKILRFEISTR